MIMKRLASIFLVFALLATTCVFLKGHAVKAAPVAQDPHYLSPSEMALSPDGNTLYVVCEQSQTVQAVDLKHVRPMRSVAVGRVPRSIAISPDGRLLYVTNSWDDSVSVIDAEHMRVVRSMATGKEPYGIALAGQRLYVANRISSDISVLDAADGKLIRTIAAGNGASYLALSPDGKYVYCSHVYPAVGKDRTPSELSMPWIGSIHVDVNPLEDRKQPESAITAIDTRTLQAQLIPEHDVAGAFHLAISADGRLGVVAEMRPKNLVPLAHVEHGWAFGYNLMLFGSDVGKPVHIPLDTLERYDSYPYAVAILPDKTRIYVSATGSDQVTVIDVRKLLRYVHMHGRDFSDDLSASAHYVLRQIPVGKNPRGMIMSRDGRFIYVANRMDDTIAVIDTQKNQVTENIDMGGSKQIDAMRRGEQVFYSSKYAYHGQFSCANCHIDGTLDGLSWDLEPDGFGKNIVQNRLLENLRGTEPFKWVGSNPTIAQECGIRTSLYFYRSEGYDWRALADLVLYIRSIPSRPNRFLAADHQLTSSQQRGKDIFYRTTNKAGMPIPLENQCSFCHSGPKYTDQKSFDVGSGHPTDTTSKFDTPHLTNVALMAPYMHDGSSRTLEEIWTLYNMDNKHGQTTDLTKDELHDLVEFLKTL
jgi:YVTN family beta-propeller protein